MTLSLGKSVASLTLCLVLAGCGGATTSLPGSSAEPSPAVSMERQAAGLMCAEDGIGDCAVGDIGTGGGTVISVVAGAGAGGATILEVAPKGWSGMETDPEVVSWEDGMTRAAGYTGGEKADWNLPTREELNILWEYPERDVIGGFGRDADGGSAVGYWSSDSNKNLAWWQQFEDGTVATFDKSNSVLLIRPVRTYTSPSK